MTIRFLVLGGATLALTACSEFDGPTTEGGFIKELPESVTSIAAPYQDLTAVKIDPIDRCLVYRHVGKVETTLLPLRTKSGSPICLPKEA